MNNQERLLSCRSSDLEGDVDGFEGPVQKGKGLCATADPASRPTPRPHTNRAAGETFVPFPPHLARLCHRQFSLLSPLLALLKTCATTLCRFTKP